MTKKKPIFNPNVELTKSTEISEEEKSFLKGADNATKVSQKKKGKKNKPHSISMSDDFYNTLKRFSEKYPEEGGISALVVRACTKYMKREDPDFKIVN